MARQNHHYRLWLVLGSVALLAMGVLPPTLHATQEGTVTAAHSTPGTQPQFHRILDVPVPGDATRAQAAGTRGGVRTPDGYGETAVESCWGSGEAPRQLLTQRIRGECIADCDLVQGRCQRECPPPPGPPGDPAFKPFYCVADCVQSAERCRAQCANLPD